MDELQNECTSLINSAHTTDDMNEKINYLSSVLEILFQRDRMKYIYRKPIYCKSKSPCKTKSQGAKAYVLPDNV